MDGDTMIDRETMIDVMDGDTMIDSEVLDLEVEST